MPLTFDSDLVDGETAARLAGEETPPAGDLWMLATVAAWEERLERARAAARREPTNTLLASPS